MLCEQDIAGDDRLLGHGRPTAQAQLGGDDALVHLRVLRQARILSVLGDDSVERLDVLERTAHENGIGNALAIIGEDPHTGR